MRAFFIVNPCSGGGRKLHRLEEAIESLRSLGWEVGRAESRARGDGTPLAQVAVAEGWDTVVACGGDGTTNEVIQPLVGTRVALGVIPLGTANVFARQERIPLDPIGAARVLATGTPREVDVGVADGRYFLLWMGMGFDAEVVYKMENDQASKRLWGIAGFAAAALGQGIRYKAHTARLTIDGRVATRDVFMLLACNARFYAVMEIAGRARMDDGKLDVLVFEGRGIGAKLRHAVGVILRRHYRSPLLEYFQTPGLYIRGGGMLAHVDGEPLDGPVRRIGLVRGGLRVMVPSLEAEPC